MSYVVKVLDKAERELKNLSQENFRRVSEAINNLAENPKPSGFKLVKGLKEHFRIRVGDYRIIYKLEKKLLVVVVVRIGHRREVYRNIR